MGSLPLNDILNRLDELRAVFVLGQRAMPFIEEVLAFLREIVPILDEVDSSIRVSTSKMMPTATSRIASVNQATELATTEIMDLVDETNEKVKKTKDMIGRAGKHLQALDDVDRRLLSLLRMKITDPEVLSEVEVLIREKDARRAEIATTLDKKAAILDEIRTNMNAIMMSLQVQDITSQQLASVSHLIESVRERLSKFEGRLGSGTLENFLDTSTPGNVAFDGNASYDRTGKKQEAADAVIASFANASPSDATEGEATPSQEEIDAMFGGAQPPTTAPASQDEVDALFAGDGAPASPTDQEEIDAMFKQGGEPASQDDIDKLFNGQ
ncbi:protein phosphatase CheZ [Rhodocaloribacter sp.]